MTEQDIDVAADPVHAPLLVHGADDERPLQDTARGTGGELGLGLDGRDDAEGRLVAVVEVDPGQRDADRQGRAISPLQRAPYLGSLHGARVQQVEDA